MAAPLHGETFRNARRIVTGQDPSSINVADLNGDGHPDLLYGIAAGTTEQATGSIHTLLWQPGNVYVAGPVLQLPADTNPLCRAGDLNGDGLTDLLCPSVSFPLPNTTNYRTSLVFFAGKGDGTFAAPLYSPVNTGTGASYGYPLISTFADTNRDGRLDVLVTDASAGTYTMLGDGAGSFTFSQQVNSGNGVSLLLDVNGDGVPDVVLTNGPIVQLGRGDGTFGPNLNSGSASGCAYADVDGDGRPDAVCAYLQGHGIHVLHGNGDGTFTRTAPSQTFPDGPTNDAGSAMLSAVLAVGDSNGDGIPDILGISDDGWTTILGRAGVMFDTPRHFAAGYQPGTQTFAQLFPQYQFVDLDGDGKPDLVAAGPNGLYITSSQNPVSQQPPEAMDVTEPLYSVGHAALADFDGDGVPDVAASGSRDLTFSKGIGDGTFQPPHAVANAALDFSTPVTSTQAALLAGDFDGDGKQDLLAIGSPSIYSYRPYLLHGLGDGTFRSPVAVSLPLNYFSNGANRPVYDVNGDGKDDLLYVPYPMPSTPSAIYVALSNGDGTFRTVSTAVPVDPAYSAYSLLPVLADLNGDGRLDAVYGLAANAYVVPGRGDGTFNAGAAVQLPIPKATGQTNFTTQAVTTGDFDGDGHPDFALLTSSFPVKYTADVVGSALLVYYGNGDGTFSAPVQHSFARVYMDVLGADVDKDGITDLVLNNAGAFGAKAVAVLHGRQDRTLGSEVNYYAGNAISNMAAADLDRDGFPDLLFTNGDLNLMANSVTVLMNLRNGSPLSGSLAAAPEPSTVGQAFDIIATLYPAAGETLAGSISFQVDGVDIGSSTLAANSARIAGPANLAAGTHALTASWAGDATHGAITLTGSHKVTALPLRASSMTLSASPATIYTGQVATFTASITDAAGGTVPAGTVDFTDGPTALGTSRLGSDGRATLAVPLTGSGTHTVIATYSGDALHNGTTAPTTVQVLKLPMTLVLTSPVNPSQAFTPVTFNVRLASTQPTTLTFDLPVALTDGGSPLPASGTLAANGSGSLLVNGLAIGSHTVAAAFAGNSSMEAAASSPVIQVVTPIATQVVISVIANPSYLGQTVTIAALVANVANAASIPGLPPHTGAVRFLDGNSVLGEMSLSGTAATFATATLAVGSHPLTAVYLGDAAYAGSSSITIVETILSSGLLLSADPASLSLATQHHMTFMLKASSAGAFADTLTFSAGDLPPHASIRLGATSMRLSAGASVSTPVYLDTSDVIGYLAQTNHRSRGAADGCMLAGILTLPLGLVLAARKRRSAGSLLLFAMAMLSLGATGCAGKYPGSVAPGSYTLHLSAAGRDTGLTRTLDLPLTVTP